MSTILRREPVGWNHTGGPKVSRFGGFAKGEPTARFELVRGLRVALADGGLGVVETAGKPALSGLDQMNAWIGNGDPVVIFDILIGHNLDAWITCANPFDRIIISVHAEPTKAPTALSALLALTNTHRTGAKFDCHV